MKENYHTHTWRCNHATGTEEQYVQSAIERGLSVLGFSDHSPYLFPGSYYSRFRMKMEQLDDYIRTITELREKYRNQIRIPLGLETEYYPKLFPDLAAVLRDKPIDYLILGQHFTNNEIDGVYCANATTDPGDLKAYCTQVLDAMQTGLFTYVAHPDIIHFQGSQTLYRDWMRRICQESKSTGIPLELNFLGLHTGRNYPNRAFLELVAEENCSMILGCDAHSPEELRNTDVEKRAKALLAEYGIPILSTTPLRPVR